MLPNINIVDKIIKTIFTAYNYNGQQHLRSVFPHRILTLYVPYSAA